MFEVGQYVVKANTGVCRVEQITMYSCSEDEEQKLCYLLSPCGRENAKLFVPVESDRSNMRRIMTEEEAAGLLARIPQIEAAVIVSEKLREQGYKDAIKSNDPEALVRILKNLNRRTRERELQGKRSTAIDERYMGLAETALYTELATALGKEIGDMKRLFSEMEAMFEA